MQATLHNRGTAATANSTLRSSIPEALTYVDGSLRCATGACRISDNQVLWNGSIGAQETITVTWNVALITALPDGTLLETEALLSDGAGQTVASSARVRAQRSDFRASHLLLRPAYIEPGQSSELLLFVQNQGSIGSVAEASVDLPESLAFDADSLACSSGACALDGRTIRWSGSVDSRSLVQIRLRISVAPQTSYGDRFVITAQVLDTTWVEESAYDAALTVAHNLYMPVAPVAKRPEIDTYLPVLIH